GQKIYRWSGVCGKIEFESDGTFDLDLGPCVKINNDQAVQCLCKGSGLFGLFMKASFPPELKKERHDMRYVAVTCSAVLLAILFLSVIILICWSPKITLKFTEKSTGKLRYKHVGTNCSDGFSSKHSWLEDCRCFTSTITKSTRSANTLPSRHHYVLPNNSLCHKEHNFDSQLRTIKYVIESDSVYMDMNQGNEETVMNMQIGSNENCNYVNAYDSTNSHKPQVLDADSVDDDNWVLSPKEDQCTYLPMRGILAGSNCQDSSK
ncbi:hypothetical protein SK128_027696, partial [Halocaridina rubra]